MFLIFVILLANPLLANAVSNETCHPEYEFFCDNYCIPLDFRCDHIGDCTDGLDEESCEYLHSCPEGDFICKKSGECINGELKCNGEHDCADGTDEVGCFEMDLLRARFNRSAWLTFSLGFLAVSVVVVSLACIIFSQYPSIRHRFELIVGTSVPIVSTPTRRSKKNAMSPTISSVNTPVVRSNSASFYNPLYNTPASPLMDDTTTDTRSEP